MTKHKRDFLSPENIEPGDQLELQPFNPHTDARAYCVIVAEILNDGTAIMVESPNFKRARRAEWSQLHGGWYCDRIPSINSISAEGILRNPKTNTAYVLATSDSLRFLWDQNRRRLAGLPWTDLYLEHRA